MFQLYRDNLEDLLQGIPNKKKKSQPFDPMKRNMGTSKQLKVTLAEHSPTGLVQVKPLFFLSFHISFFYC